MGKGNGERVNNNGGKGWREWMRGMAERPVSVP
jgi:hypothetical protein